MKYKKMTALLCAAAIALGGCSASGSAGEEETQELTAYEKALAYMADMDERDKEAQLVCMAIRTWNGENLTEMNEEVSALLEKYHFGGICLFRENISTDNEQTVRLSQAMQKAVIESGGAPMFICADQEGGYVYRLSGGTQTPGNMALAASGDLSNTAEAAGIIGSEMDALGINTDFAPVTDINSNPANPVIGVRSFSDDAETVVKYSEEYINALHQYGVIASLKHFPGHGDTATDSHTGLPLIEKTEAELEASDLIPFTQLTANGYQDMIMSAHIQFPNIDDTAYTSKLDGSKITLPATLSEKILTGILREKIGFEGVIITDSLIMDAIAQHFDSADTTAMAINAGVDMLLMPVDLKGTDTVADLDAWMDQFHELVENGTISQERIDESVLRILTLKIERGIMEREYSDDMTEQMVKNAAALVGSEENHEKEIAISEKAATVIENNGVLPVQAEEDMKIVMAGINAAQTNAFGYAFKRLVENGVIPEETEGVFINLDWTNNVAEVQNALSDADLLIFNDNLYSPELLNPEYSDQIPVLQELIHTAQEGGVSVIAISAGLPYDLPLLNDADGLVAVYCQTGINSCEEDYTPVGTYGTGVIGAMDVIFGVVSPQGKLPVNIPSIEGTSFGSDYVYERGYGLTW